MGFESMNELLGCDGLGRMRMKSKAEGHKHKDACHDCYQSPV